MVAWSSWRRLRLIPPCLAPTLGGRGRSAPRHNKLTAILEREGLPYAIIGAMALNEYGHRRVTVDVDLVMREESLQAFKLKYLGNGYAERGAGTGKLLDTDHGVNVGVLSTGRFPGDDKPKPIAFPDPAEVALRGENFALLPVELYIELKLASGMVAPHRAKDLVDVQELIKSAALATAGCLRVRQWATPGVPGRGLGTHSGRALRGRAVIAVDTNILVGLAGVPDRRADRRRGRLLACASGSAGGR